MRIITSAVIVTILVLASSCEDVVIQNSDNAFVRYAYTAFDTSGNTITRGTLWLQFDSSNVTGLCLFDGGKWGELEGWLSRDTLALNLNPRFVDNNLLLCGVLTARTYTGKWERVGFPGVMASGMFSAMRE